MPAAPVRMGARQEGASMVRTARLRCFCQKLLPQPVDRPHAIPLDDMADDRRTRSRQADIGPRGGDPCRRTKRRINRIDPVARLVPKSRPSITLKDRDPDLSELERLCHGFEPLRLRNVAGGFDLAVDRRRDRQPKSVRMPLIRLAPPGVMRMPCRHIRAAAAMIRSFWPQLTELWF